MHNSSGSIVENRKLKTLEAMESSVVARAWEQEGMKRQSIGVVGY